MKQVNIDDISQEQNDAIFGHIAQLAAQTFRNMDLSADLVKAAQMQLLKSSLPQDPAEITQDFIANSVFPKAVNSVFAGYQQDCYRFCLSKTQDTELSGDIAQEAIKLLLLSKNKVESISAWLIQVTYNLLCDHYGKSEKERKLYNRLALETKSYEKWLVSGDPMELKELDPATMEKLLDSEEYQEYHELMSYASLKDFAAAHDISEKVAQKRKEKIVRNLKSKALLSMGWNASPGILNYNQYNSIRRFIREMLKTIGGEEEIEWLKHLSPEQTQDVRKIKNIIDWGIAMTGDRRFKLFLFTLFEDEQPFLVTFHITMDQRNSISIQDFRVNQLLGSFKQAPISGLPMDKGRAIWGHNEVMALLKEK